MKYLCCQQIFSIKVPNSNKVELLDTDYSIYLTILKEHFGFKHKTNIKFLLNINDITMNEAVKQFQDHTINAIKYLDHIYHYYSHFINLIQLKYISKKDLIIIVIFNIDSLHYYNLNYYSHDSELFDFCLKCWNYIKEGELPKFGILNKIP